MTGILTIAALGLLGCNPDPGEVDKQVGYRDGLDGGATNGERGNIKISEILWSGSIMDGERDQSDVFLELRNEGARPVNVSGWHLIMEGSRTVTWRIPDSDRMVEVGEHVFIAAKTDRCFPEPDYVLPELSFPDGDSFRVTLRDVDERLIESAGSKTEAVFAGGYDLVRSRSMEKVELMFGGRGTEPSSWHYYTPAEVDVPNNDRIAEDCRSHTLASPGRANSPDYSGAYSTGSFE